MERLEQYCRENRWNLYTTEGYLCAEKNMNPCYGAQISHKFEIAMDTDAMIKELREEDGYPMNEEEQMLFAFV